MFFPVFCTNACAQDAGNRCILQDKIRSARVGAKLLNSLTGEMPRCLAAVGMYVNGQDTYAHDGGNSCILHYKIRSARVGAKLLSGSSHEPKKLGPHSTYDRFTNSSVYKQIKKCCLHF